MKCSKCNAVLRENDELKWECNTCHQMCKANLTMLMQIQAQRNNGYTRTMVNCPFCGGVLDDGHETIHWDCMYCGTRRTGDIKTFLSPEVVTQPEQPQNIQKSAEEAGLVWESSEEAEGVKDPRAERRARREREREERLREREEREKKSFFEDEEAKNRFIAESSIQTLGEEIPDSLFDDIPFRGKPKSVPETKAATPEVPAASAASSGAPTAPTGVAASSEPPKAPTAPTNTAPTSAAAPPKAPEVPTNTAPTSAAAPPKTPTAPASAAASPKASAAPASAATAPKPPANTTSPEAATQRRPLGPKTASGPIPPSSTAFAPSTSATAPTGPHSDRALEDVSFEREKEPVKKQIWPKVITTVITLLLLAAVGIGGYVAVKYFLAPTRQFRSAVQKADYTTAEEIYTSQIKGNQEDERIAEIAVEHFLSEAFELYKSGARDSSEYMQIKDFAESVLHMNTSNYELAATTPPPEDLMPSPSPDSEPTEEPSASPSVSEEPSASATPSSTEEATATEEPEATPEVTEEPEESDTADDDISAVLAQAKEYVRQKQYEEAYNYLAPHKKGDTSGQVKKEMAAVQKKWEAANIKEFKALCANLTIVYVASERQYHIVPRGYYTNYNQIARSNNVGGIAYMNQSKKKVSVTKIGKKGAITTYGKTNRAYLMKFKEMIEKYPYLAEQI